MNRLNFSSMALALLVAGGLGMTAVLLRGADEPAQPSPAPASPREDLRDQFKNLTPEEREAKMKEFRAKYGQNGPEREMWDKRRESLKDLPPEEREKKMREWHQSATNATRTFDPEDIEKKRNELRSRLERQLAELRAKQTNNTLSPEESKRLERMEEISKRLEKGGLPGMRPSPPQKPGSPPQDPKP